MKSRLITLALVSAGISPTGALNAQASGKVSADLLCQSQHTDRQLRSAKNLFGEVDYRLEQMDQLIEEMRTTQEALNTRNPQYPKSFYRTCLARKNEAFLALVSQSPESGRGRAAFHKSVGEYHLLKGQKRSALKSFDLALKLDPSDLSLQWKSFDLFSALQGHHLSLKDSGGDAARLRQTTLAEAHARLTTMLNAPNLDSFNRARILEHQSLLFEGQEKWFEAQKAWQEILHLQPQNQGAAEKLISLHLKRGERERGAELLEGLWMRDQNRVDRAIQLSQIYFDLKAPAAALKILKEAREHHPKDTRVEALWALALYANDLRDEGVETAKSLLKREPGSLPAQKVMGLEEERRGDEHREKGQPGLAFAAYRKALEWDPASLSLREKIVRHLHSQLKASHFQPQEAARKDLQYVSQLLRPRLDARESLTEVSYEALLDAADILPDPALKESLCRNPAALSLSLRPRCKASPAAHPSSR